MLRQKQTRKQKQMQKGKQSKGKAKPKAMQRQSQIKSKAKVFEAKHEQSKFRGKANQAQIEQQQLWQFLVFLGFLFTGTVDFSQGFLGDFGERPSINHVGGHWKCQFRPRLRSVAAIPNPDRFRLLEGQCLLVALCWRVRRAA